jgi:murein DD-endopeptidase MepM/ murein hydrolase activator NlpD
VRAADNGNVVQASPYGGYGNYVCVQHEGALSTCYAHLSSFNVGTGDSVQQGDIVGSSGCTGSCYGDHLHFETRVNGAPTDPMGYL